MVVFALVVSVDGCVGLVAATVRCLSLFVAVNGCVTLSGVVDSCATLLDVVKGCVTFVTAFDEKCEQSSLSLLQITSINSIINIKIYYQLFINDAILQ